MLPLDTVLAWLLIVAFHFSLPTRPASRSCNVVVSNTALLDCSAAACMASKIMGCCIYVTRGVKVDRV